MSHDLLVLSIDQQISVYCGIQELQCITHIYDWLTAIRTIYNVTYSAILHCWIGVTHIQDNWFLVRSYDLAVFERV